MLCFLRAQVELEPLPESACNLGNADRETRHAGIVSHHRYQVNNVICRAA